MFQAGKESGKASNVSIHRLAGGWTALVGYGWAVYAVRDNSGTIHAYRGWHGYSPATSTQLTKMGISHPHDTSFNETDRYMSDRCIVDVFHDGRPTHSEFQRSSLDEIDLSDM